MKVQDILDRKGRDVVTVAPGQTVAAALRLLVDHGIGSLVVLEGEEIVGIITERDVLRLTDRDPAALATTRIGEVMTQDLIWVVPEDGVDYVMDVMTRNRVRHLPVVGGGSLKGIVSIGDVVNAVRRDAEAENRYMRDYVRGMVR
jgi:CBS domain-containing protein